MENNAFKSVAFGGFDKQDVVHYIEETAKAHEEELTRLRRENEELSGTSASLQEQTEALRQKAEEAEAECARLRTSLEAVTAERDSLRAEGSDCKRMRDEAEALRPDAEAYRQLRENVGSIECDARKRAAELERSTVARLRQLVTDFHAQYGELATTFDATARHLTDELRKVEVNLVQLPRSLDQVGVNLTELESTLEGKDEESKS